MLDGLMRGEGLALVSAKNKATGKSEILVAVMQRDKEGVPQVYPVGVMFTDDQYAATLDYYELPPMLQVSPEGTTIPTGDETEALMDRIFPNRKKD